MRKSLTIVAVADTKVIETINALKISSNKINCKKVVLLSSKNIDRFYFFKELKIIKINPLKSFKDYNHFIIYHYTNTTSSHILLVQWDGFMLNIKNGMKIPCYDFIGALFIPRAKNYSYSRDKYGDFYSIGNGGFSLRSLNLLRAASKYKLGDNKSRTHNHEDGFFCLPSKILESKGLKWAPFSLAKSFQLKRLLILGIF